MAMGMSAAPYVAQMTNNFLTEVFSRKFTVYCSVYLDDVWTEKKDNVPKFENWAGEFGLKFKASKSEEGSEITLLGVQINLSDKTAKIDSDKAEKIEIDAKFMLEHRFTSSKRLAAFYGRLEFAAQVCPLGRAFTQAITKQMGDGQLDINLLSENDRINLSEKSLKEVDFWSKIKDQAPLKIGRRKFSNGNVMASDSSGERWAYIIGNKSYADVFPESFKNEHINVKESYAVAKLVETALSPDTDFQILCDNTCTVASFTKGRSSNEKIHNLIKSTLERLDKVNSRLKVIWISTARMEQYADGPSRGIYVRDDYGLTFKGIDRIIELFPSFERRRGENDLVSMFGGPKNNPAKVKYFALDIDATDPLSAKTDAFQALEKRRAEGRKFAGGVLAYPPVILINSFNKFIREIGLDRDTEIYYLLPAHQVGKTINMIVGKGNIDTELFSGKYNTNLFHRKLSCNMTLLHISSFDLNGSGPEKRFRRF